MPPLDEGAIAVNVVRLPNASLDGSVQVATFLEKRLARFPEVEAVVSKTGRAEISEDPMGPEQTDVFIMLKPRSEWRAGRTKAELVAAINNSLAAIPGLRLSFSQPIALRVNELISGVKSDLAVKVFGADLEKLKGLKIDGQMKRARTPGRFGAAADAAATRREQREREGAQGLVPFAVKLDGALVKRIQALAQDRKTGLSEVAAELLEKGEAIIGSLSREATPTLPAAPVSG